MTKAMPFLQKVILLSYDPRSFGQGPFCTKVQKKRKKSNAILGRVCYDKIG